LLYRGQSSFVCFVCSVVRLSHPGALIDFRFQLFSILLVRFHVANQTESLPNSVWKQQSDGTLPRVLDFVEF
jgi:hypothetical protein